MKIYVINHTTQLREMIRYFQWQIGHCAVSRMFPELNLWVWRYQQLVLNVLTAQNQSAPPHLVISYHTEARKMAAISQTTLRSILSCIEIAVVWFKFHWYLFTMVQLTRSQHWVRKWLDADQAATICYLNQWLFSLLTHISVTPRPHWVNTAHWGSCCCQCFPSEKRLGIRVSNFAFSALIQLLFVDRAA